MRYLIALFLLFTLIGCEESFKVEQESSSTSTSSTSALIDNDANLKLN